MGFRVQRTQSTQSSALIPSFFFFFLRGGGGGGGLMGSIITHYWATWMIAILVTGDWLLSCTTILIREVHQLLVIFSTVPPLTSSFVFGQSLFGLLLGVRKPASSTWLEQSGSLWKGPCPPTKRSKGNAKNNTRMLSNPSYQASARRRGCLKMHCH